METPAARFNADLSDARVSVAPMLSETFAHDLGNLIQVASSAINILARDPRIAISDAGDNALAHARAALAQAGELLQQSLWSGRQAAEEDVDIEACLDRLRPLLIQVCGTAIRLELTTERLPKVTCRRLELDNVILNLVLNARDAMPDGGVLRLGASVAEGPDVPEVQLVVADTGIGMTPEVAARATEPFFTTKASGNGIGLASVARFVAEARGRLFVESAPGLGTSVTIRLPAAGAWLFG